VSGTSEGIVSRSFIERLRELFPKAYIQVAYTRTHISEDHLSLLPIDLLEVFNIPLKPSAPVKWMNRITRIIFGFYFYEWFISQKFRKALRKINCDDFDYIFVRSAGLKYELIRALRGTQLLSKSIINIHDPFPLFWYPDSGKALKNTDIFEFKQMREVLLTSAKIICPSKKLSKDLRLLYVLDKKIYILPHQFSKSVFPKLTNIEKAFNKKKRFTICYHGSIQFGRDLRILLDAYMCLIENSHELKNLTEMVLRLKSNEVFALQSEYNSENVRVLEGVEFATALYEQEEIADINILLDNGRVYSNVLVGKAPVLASTGNAVLVLTPLDSELRDIISDNSFVANSGDKIDIQRKLLHLINATIESQMNQDIFQGYFSTDEFNKSISSVISTNSH
jgi:hypothetical protein